MSGRPGPGKPPPDKQCTANTKRTGERCQDWAVAGTNVCRRHGAAKGTPARNKIEREKQQAAAEAAVVAYGLPREVDPHTALLEELWHTAGHVAWLREKVQALEEHRMHGPVGGSEHGIPREEPHVWIRLYQQERQHLAGVARDCVKAGIEERRVRLAEQQGALMAQVIRGILADLGVDSRPEVPAIVRKHLQLVAGA